MMYDSFNDIPLKERLIFVHNSWYIAVPDKGCLSCDFHCNDPCFGYTRCNEFQSIVKYPISCAFIKDTFAINIQEKLFL